MGHEAGGRGSEGREENCEIHTLVLLVEGTVATPPAEGVGLGVPLTVRIREL